MTEVNSNLPAVDWSTILNGAMNIHNIAATSINLKKTVCGFALKYSFHSKSVSNYLAYIIPILLRQFSLNVEKGTENDFKELDLLEIIITSGLPVLFKLSVDGLIGISKWTDIMDSFINVLFPQKVETQAHQVTYRIFFKFYSIFVAVFSTIVS